MSEQQAVVPDPNAAPATPKFRNAAGKWVIDYQPTDEAGNPIGRKTHLEADTPEELIEKQLASQDAAVKAYFKLKNQKPEPKVARSDFKPKTTSADEEFQTFSESQQPGTFRAAVRKTIEAELGAPIEEIRESVKVARSVDTKMEVDAFLRAHAGVDYHPCKDNQDKMLAFLKDYRDADCPNGLEISSSNLEFALETLNLQGKLLPVPAAPAAVQEEVPADNPPQQPRARRQASTGVLPGEASGNRPAGASRPGQLTWAFFDKMSDAEWDKAKRNPTYVKWMNDHPR